MPLGGGRYSQGQTLLLGGSPNCLDEARSGHRPDTYRCRWAGDAHRFRSARL